MTIPLGGPRSPAASGRGPGGRAKPPARRRARARLRGLALALALVLAGAACGPAPAREPVRAGAGAERGSLRYDTVRSRALRGNPPGDPPEREVVVYLPPGYHASPGLRYPVVYLLHGFDGDGRQFLAPPFSLPSALDSLLAAGAIEPMIVVLPDGRNRSAGSFFANTRAMGRWGDFVAREVVEWVDGEYRTVAEREGRGIAGWSMGGFGALALAMDHPDVFGAVYALSPCCLGPEMLRDYGPAHPAWGEILSLRGWEDASGAGFHARLLLAAAAAASPGEGGDPDAGALPLGGRPGGCRPPRPPIHAGAPRRWNRASRRISERCGGSAGSGWTRGTATPSGTSPSPRAASRRR